MQRIKAIMFVIVSINLITAIKTDSPIIGVLAIGAALLSTYNIYLIRKVNTNA